MSEASIASTLQCPQILDQALTKVRHRTAYTISIDQLLNSNPTVHQLRMHTCMVTTQSFYVVAKTRLTRDT